MAVDIVQMGLKFAETHNTVLADHWKNQLRNAQRQFVKDGDANAAANAIASAVGSATNGYHAKSSEINDLQKQIERG